MGLRCKHCHTLWDVCGLDATWRKHGYYLCEICGEKWPTLYTICAIHEEKYQELWPGEWLCENCFVEHFHCQDDC